MLARMLEDHPHRPFAYLWGILPGFCHDSILSRNGVSGNPGAVHLRAVSEHHERLTRLEHQLADQLGPSSMQPVVAALQTLRGVQWTVAVTTVAELGDLTRFDQPRQLMAYLGLTPSEYSTGEQRRQGGITKTGNRHARRVLV